MKKIMEKGKHGKDELTFEKLDFQGQSRSINGQINRLVTSVKAHIRQDSQKGVEEANRRRLKCIHQLARAIYRITN